MPMRQEILENHWRKVKPAASPSASPREPWESRLPMAKDTSSMPQEPRIAGKGSMDRPEVPISLGIPHPKRLKSRWKQCQTKNKTKQKVLPGHEAIGHLTTPTLEHLIHTHRPSGPLERRKRCRPPQSMPHNRSQAAMPRF